VALRAAGLSVESLAAVQVVIDHARRLEGLEAESGTEDPGTGPEGSGADGTGADAAGADRVGACEAGAGGQDGDHARGAG
jgi:hypothetical protein